MNSQQLLLINFLIFASVAAMLIFGRNRSKNNLKLNLKAKTDKTLDLVLTPVPETETDPYKLLQVSKSDGYDVIVKNYQELIKSADINKIEIYEEAFNKITKERKNT